jgi:hypothetical protein
VNRDVYDTLNQARAKLFNMRVSHDMSLVSDDFKSEIDVIAMAVDDGLDELDRLNSQMKLRGGNKK